MLREIAMTSKRLFEGVFVPRVVDGGVEIARRQPEKPFVHFLQFPASIQNQWKRPTQPNVLYEVDIIFVVRVRGLSTRRINYSEYSQ